MGIFSRADKSNGNVDPAKGNSAASKNLITLDTKNATYLLVFESHIKKESNATDHIANCDAFVIESGANTYKELQGPTIRRDKQYRKLMDMNLSLSRPKPIFYADVPSRFDHLKLPYGLDSKNTTGYLVALGAEVIPLVIMGAVGIYSSTAYRPLVIPFASFTLSSIVVGMDMRLAKPMGYLELCNCFTTGAMRSALSVKKMEEFIAPALQKRLGRKPVILVTYGSGHADMIPYLKHEKIRDGVIGWHKLGGFLRSDKEHLNLVSEINFNGDPLKLGTVVYRGQSGGDWDYVQTISKVNCT